MKYYVHIPFCHSKCAYCDFYSTPAAEGLKEMFVDSVYGELHERLGGLEKIETLYLGGGTPSSLSRELLCKLISYFQIDDSVKEVTIEANPEDVTDGFARFVSSLSPVARVSMGVQSMNDGELSFIGRRHSASDAENAFHTLRTGGVDNISLDLIYGLPGQSLASWKKSLDKVLALRPEHLSAYLLSYEPQTRLGVMLSKGKVQEASAELAEDMYSYLCYAAGKAGYEHYEISNFALPHYRAVHNSSYWDGSEYAGLGPGAHSYMNGLRGYNRLSLKDYIATKGCGVYEEDPETEFSRFNDLVITSLRTSSGIPFDVLSAYPESKSVALRLLSAGFLEETLDGHVAIPERLWLKSDSIMRELIIV